MSNSTDSSLFSSPQRGASMMLAFRCIGKRTLIIGSNRLAALRAFSALEADSHVVVLARGGIDSSCEELKYRAQNQELEIWDLNAIAAASKSASSHEWDDDVVAIMNYLDTHGPVSFVCVTDTLTDTDPNAIRRSDISARHIYQGCRSRNIPVNVTDMPSLCDFTFCSSHRFTNTSTGQSTPLQVAITTNGQGCRLAGRIKRDIVAMLPQDVGNAVEQVGRLRNSAKRLETVPSDLPEEPGENGQEMSDEITIPSPNVPVEQRTVTSSEDDAERRRRRLKWVAQISEYWSISSLARLTDADMHELLTGDLLQPSTSSTHNHLPSTLQSHHGLELACSVPSPLKQGRVLLVGSGPGHPSLLTLAAHEALTKHADLVLTDKLVPAGVLAIIPERIEVRVARKFPGNADGAQQEMMEIALSAAREGKTVVRLKQGDPALYGRVGEEVLFLRSHGIEATIIPGISSALAAPLFAQIPVTQRGAAESLILCTGVGRSGRDVRLPGYERGRTLVVLMGIARLKSIANALLEIPEDDKLGNVKPDRRSDQAYPSYIPAAIIERASMPDQRVIYSTLCDIVTALESTGEQRPPGLLVVGWSVLSLWAEGDMTILDEDTSYGDVTVRERDVRRVEKWLEGKKWRIQEGIESTWDMFDRQGK